MAYDPLEKLKIGDVDFLLENWITASDERSVIERVRKSEYRKEIVEICLPKLIKYKSKFCFGIIYDMEEYKSTTLSLIQKYDNFKFNEQEIKNILYNTEYAEEFILENLDTYLEENTSLFMSIFIDFAYNKAKQKDKWISKLSLHKNLNYRATFILQIIKSRPKELKLIYGDITKYLTEYNYLANEQLKFDPEKMNPSHLSRIVYECLNSPLNKKLYKDLKEYLLINYKENNLAQLFLLGDWVKITETSQELVKNEKAINEFKKDADRLFNTSKSYQLQILQQYSQHISQELINNLQYYINIFYREQLDWSPNINKVFNYGIGNNLKGYVDKYLDLSADRSVEFIGKGTTSTCYRLGDYTFKLVGGKWSYEDIICPNIYLIAKNLEEIHIRSKENYVMAGLEIMQYLKTTAEKLPDEYFIQFLTDLNKLGYYTTDTLMGGTHGDNCRILDSYKDADHVNPESLPDYFKQTPLVLVDRDRIYRLENKHPKQIRESMD